jgi:hypothetical protein
MFHDNKKRTSQMAGASVFFVPVCPVSISEKRYGYPSVSIIVGILACAFGRIRLHLLPYLPSFPVADSRRGKQTPALTVTG